jgi:hypothetical protein
MRRLDNVIVTAERKAAASHIFFFSFSVLWPQFISLMARTEKRKKENEVPS